MIETQCCSTHGPEAKASVPPARHTATEQFKQENDCPGCRIQFTPARRNQKYCTPSCQKMATRNTARGAREIENKTRTERHYDRAAWLSYDLNRMQPVRQRAMVLALLEAASGDDPALRNILLDPKLLGADRWSAIGKFYPDTKCPRVLNIAKLINSFCISEWGCGVRDAILDHGKPAHRVFREPEPTEVIRPPHIYERPLSAPVKVHRMVPSGTQPYDWRRIAKTTGDRGWRRYFSDQELDQLL